MRVRRPSRARCASSVVSRKSIGANRRRRTRRILTGRQIRKHAVARRDGSSTPQAPAAQESDHRSGAGSLAFVAPERGARLRSLSDMPDLRLVPKPELDRLRAPTSSGRQARAARRRVPAERARGRQTRRLGASRLHVQRARPRRAPLFDELDVAARGFDDPDRDVFFSSKGHDVPGCTRYSSRSASSRASGCSACAVSAGSTGTRMSACPGSRRARARSGWASPRGVGSRSPSVSSAATAGSS